MLLPGEMGNSLLRISRGTTELYSSDLYFEGSVPWCWWLLKGESIRVSNSSQAGPSIEEFAVDSLDQVEPREDTELELNERVQDGERVSGGSQEEGAESEREKEEG